MNKEYNLGKAKGKFDELYTEPLEALETIKNATTKGSGWCDVEIKYEFPREIEIIEKSLKEVEKLKKVNLELNKLVDILSKENTLLSRMVEDDK